MDNLKLFDDGTYLYKSQTGKFDIDRFNRDYDQYKKQRTNEMEEKLTHKLEILNKPPEEIPIYQHSIGKIFIDTKDAIFEILDDLLQFKFNLNTFTRDNRLFYIGIFLIFIACFMFLYTLVLSDENEIKKTNNNEILLKIDLNNLKN
jgi:hypothetical protein